MAQREDWHDMTTIGSDFEVQYEPYSRQWRHRPIKLSVMPHPYDGPGAFFVERGIGEWRAGMPPKAQT